MKLPTPKLHTIIAVDPGVSGAIAVLNQHGIHHWSMPTTPAMITSSLRKTIEEARLGYTAPVAVVERVNGFMGRALPGSRMFTMGENYGHVKGVLDALCVPVTLVTPQCWQGKLGLDRDKELSRDQWKGCLWRHAQALYPELVIKKQDADAILLLHYGRISLDVL